ncbi:MAG: hypothetical protein ACRD0E_03490 [Acidimicrobiales bacterium]
MPRPKPASGGWDETHKRVTFYCPTELVTLIEARASSHARSKTQVIVDALRAQFPEASP